MIVRAMNGEKVTISGADLVEGWQRDADGGWSAPMAGEPKRVLRDGRRWTEFAYDKAAARIRTKTGGDPRLHVFESVVREQAINLAGMKHVRVKGVVVLNTLEDLR